MSKRGVLFKLTKAFLLSCLEFSLHTHTHKRPHPQPRWECDRQEKRQIKPPSHDIYTVYSWQIDNILLLLHRFSEWKLRGACLFGLAEIIPIDLIRIMPSQGDSPFIYYLQSSTWDMKRIILFTAALTCVASLRAQTVTDTLKQQHLDEVVVAGVRAPKSAPYAVSNIKKQSLKPSRRVDASCLSSSHRRQVYWLGARTDSERVRLQCASEVLRVAVSTSPQTVWHSTLQRTRRCSGQI